MSKTKLFAFNNGGEYGWMGGVVMAEDGKEVCSHVSTHEGWMQRDLGVTSTLKHDIYDMKFGVDGWEIEFISYENVPSHDALQEVFDKHRALIAKTEEES